MAALLDKVGDMCDNEVFMFLKDNDFAPLRYAAEKNTGSMKTLGNLDNLMQRFWRCARDLPAHSFS